MGLTVVNVICPHCGMEDLIEDYLLNDDELKCNHCGKYISEEDEEDNN